MYPHLSDATAPYQLRPFFRKDRKQKVLAVMVPLDQLEGTGQQPQTLNTAGPVWSEGLPVLAWPPRCQHCFPLIKGGIPAPAPRGE